MNSKPGNRRYVAQALRAAGSARPSRYLEMLLQTPVHSLIAELSPWAFLANPEPMSQYCSEAVDRKVFAFAQAMEENMVACFISEPPEEPTVMIVNPWSTGHVVLAHLSNFDVWLDYAAEVSREVLARAAVESDD